MERKIMLLETIGNQFSIHITGDNRSYLGVLLPFEVIEHLENGYFDTKEAKFIREFAVYNNAYHWTFEQTVNRIKLEQALKKVLELKTKRI